MANPKKMDNGYGGKILERLIILKPIEMAYWLNKVRESNFDKILIENEETP